MYSTAKKETVEERYDTPGTGCVLWPIMEILDDKKIPTGKGYNDWRFGEFVEKKESDNLQYNAALRDMNIRTGERISKEIVVGNIGVYMVSDPEASDMYLVEWSSEPWMASEDGEEIIDGELYRWRQGDYLCRGNWLDKLFGVRNWYTWDVDDRECLVKLAQVVDANIQMRCFTSASGDNPLPKMPKASKERAEDRGAWRMSDKDYAFLLEEIRLREDNFEYDIAAANEVLQQEREEEKWATVGDLEE